MKMLLIGHRGVGKSSLLQRLQIYSSMKGQTIPVFDLDREIEKSVGAKIQDIFDLLGEKQFRILELKTYEHVLKRSEYILAVGAGFQLDQIQIDSGVQVVWVKRKSDELGRIFLDRPRLNKEVTPLQEYQERYSARNELYARHATWVYDLPEGLSSPSEIEQHIFFNQVQDLGGILTLEQKHSIQIQNFKNRYLKWDFDYFEIRDDLLSENQMQPFFASLSKAQILVSFRKQDSSKTMMKAAQEGYLSDWALELGPQPDWAQASILSLHTRREGETFFEATQRLQKFSRPSQHLKLAVEVKDFAELEQGLKWQAEDSALRSFLPRSKEGRWLWVRLWLKDRQKLNFLREGFGHSFDQPSVYDWLQAISRPQKFAAVLGHPAQFSFSPSEHFIFFKQYQMPFYAIDIEENEWDRAILLLQKMGLHSAAVTAPLKRKAFEFAQERSKLCLELQTANTLFFENQKWHAENTDLLGLQDLLGSIEMIEPVFIWGGGGTLPVIQKLLPKAVAYSVRTARPRSGSSEQREHHKQDHGTFPNTVIWAASPNAELPPSPWSPKLVVDLNYREDSRAKEYCQGVGARYISGLYMFKVQAQAQREIWGRHHASK